jgi:hypothetical protein
MGPFFEPQPPPDPELHRQPEWIGPPSNVLGAAVPLSILLVRTEDVAVTVDHVTAYRNGFELRARLRLRNQTRLHPGMMHPHGPLAGDAFRFGLQFSDGRKAANDLPRRPADDQPEQPRLIMRGGGGGPGGWDWGYWIWGLPTPGPLALVCAWPAQDVPETRVEIDAQPIIDAAAEAEELWPGSESSAGGGSVSNMLFSAPAHPAAPTPPDTRP